MPLAFFFMVKQKAHKAVKAKLQLVQAAAGTTRLGDGSIVKRYTVSHGCASTGSQPPTPSHTVVVVHYGKQCAVGSRAHSVL